MSLTEAAESGSRERVGPDAHSVTGLVTAASRIPLVLKIGGANMIIVIVALLALALTRPMDGAQTGSTIITVVALATSLLVSIGLAALALRPLGDVERTLARFVGGFSDARVTVSGSADDNMRRLAGMINGLLDSMSRDRVRLRQLADRVLTHTDAERSRLARELYDSSAQSIAALMLEVSALSASVNDATQRARLEHVRQIAATVLDEIRDLSHAAHPRLLEDRGLEVALQQLVREFSSSARITFESDGVLTSADTGAATIAYRVARVALQNAVHDRQASDVRIRLSVTSAALELDISDNGGPDDGRGEVAKALEAVRHRLDLVGGTLALSMNGRRGTRLWIPGSGGGRPTPVTEAEPPAAG